jgi:phosphate transport system substrate-binding protein
MATLRSRLTAAFAATMFVAASAPAAAAATETTAPPGGEPTASAPRFEMPTGLSGELAISGSSTVEPISAAAAVVFSASNPDVAITVEGPGTGDGFARFCAGETDISDASRPISPEEVSSCDENGVEFVELKIAIDGLSVITAAENTTIECLSFVDLYALIGPDAIGITNWSDATELADGYAESVTDLGAVRTPYPDAELAITGPGEESGTFDSFVELALAPVGEVLGAEDPLPRLDYTASPNDNVIIEGVAGNPTSLGWVGFAYVEENLDAVRPIPIDGGDGCVEPTPETIADGEYPIARDLYIYVSASRLADNPTLQAFVDYYVGQGMSTLIGSGDGQVPYVPLNAEDAAATQAVWDSRETGARGGGE